MKTIKTCHPWWDGKQVKCEFCGTVFELEADDPNKSGGWMGYDGRGSLRVGCPTCGLTALIPVPAKSNDQ